ncbi:MAG: hypothetical protein ABI330_09395, partial [Caldimonas sp.]
PSRLSAFDLQQFFQLAPDDIEAIRERFRVPPSPRRQVARRLKRRATGLTAVKNMAGDFSIGARRR